MLHRALIERAAEARPHSGSPHGGETTVLGHDRHLSNCPALVLNADYTPLSYYPLSLWPWQTAIKAVFLERVDIVATYDREVHSASLDMKIPSVIALRQYVKPSEFPAFTRFNLFLRDKFQCQYCGCPDQLTFDHVVPRRLGGRTTWENVVAACAPCNMRKGGRTPAQAAMRLITEPIRPTSWHLQERGRLFPPGHLHESWRDWLYWDVELEY
ncbi:HNH endonuclease [Novosphingobium sp. PASSN1]|uniref:HNH endonuclease n=1 Tax=Novosphingobium sp. PASSN1 TaxID=2015561 RepID=UPI000BDAF31F|nr:HNH endonuclease [Novosphingobium sp. PASSN1]OYU34133.1 MAG: HNH endonuclease [Novosphingobium sp. PASSN1]